jgi:hypothetical protein
LKRGFQFNVIVVGACVAVLQLALSRRSTRPRSQPPLASSWKLTDLLRIAGLAGQTGLGKSTLINTLFASHLIDSKGRVEADQATRSTTEIHAQSHGASRQVHVPVLLTEQWAGRARPDRALLCLGLWPMTWTQESLSLELTSR